MYDVHVSALGVPYVPRTVAPPQVTCWSCLVRTATSTRAPSWRGRSSTSSSPSPRPSSTRSQRSRCAPTSRHTAARHTAPCRHAQRYHPRPRVAEHGSAAGGRGRAEQVPGALPDWPLPLGAKEQHGRRRA
eukprot:scaffold83069_cov60-Phaeocystis_antarctica.AAC.1